MKTLYYRFLYRPIMRLLHRFDLHYAPPHNVEGDIVLRCAWCGLTYTKPKHDPKMFTKMLVDHAGKFGKAWAKEIAERHAKDPDEETLL